MKKVIIVEHVSIEVESNFYDFTFHLEKALGILMPSALQSLGAVPASMVYYLTTTNNESGLMLFNMLSQEDLVKKEHGRKIRQYQIGNPQIMYRMVENHAGTGLYMPIHLLVYESSDGKVIVEYDLPSSLCAQFNNARILSDSIMLENNLIKMIQTADGRGRGKSISDN
ncbi:DUF302 domain-containing protein [Chitinophaga ginsengisoli]|nr:DUF302 domain-containing protein [Chitinophaga ginsengisoli]